MSPDRFHVLSHVLHRDTDSLPVALHGPQAVRRSAESARRRRRGTADALYVSTLRDLPTDPSTAATQTGPPTPNELGPPAAPLVLADMLTVAGGSQSLDDITRLDTERFRPLHRCDNDVGGDAVWSRRIIATPDTPVAAQRVLSVLHPGGGITAYLALTRALEDCFGVTAFDASRVGDGLPAVVSEHEAIELTARLTGDGIDRKSPGFAPRVLLGLAGGPVTDVARQDLEEPNGWLMASAGFQEWTGPFSALTALSSGLGRPRLPLGTTEGAPPHPVCQPQSWRACAS